MPSMVRLLCLIFLLSSTPFLLQAQSSNAFPEDPAQFIAALDEFMNASKRKDLEETFKEFQENHKAQRFTEDQFKQIIDIANVMKSRRMRANPYFERYFRSINQIVSLGYMDKHFDDWITVTGSLAKDIKSAQIRSYTMYLDFCIALFSESSLKLGGRGGVQWQVVTDGFKFNYDTGNPYVSFEQLDLIGMRKEDSVAINKTSGIYYPIETLWKGEKGIVDWTRVGLDDRVFCELETYQIDINKTDYVADSVKFYNPKFFRGFYVGRLQDKLVVNPGKDGSYPRFQSYEKKIRIKNIGPKISYIGGFQMQGASVIGVGDKDNKAVMLFYDKKNQLALRTTGNSYTIKIGERIDGQNIEVAMYFNYESGQPDSITHQSVNLRFDINTRQMILNRKGLSNSTASFQNSFHKVEMDIDKIVWNLDSDKVEIGQNDVGRAGKTAEAYFESLDYYNEITYRRMQNIADANPISQMKVYSEQQGTRELDTESLAKYMNPRYKASTITPLLLTLEEDGFVTFNQENGTVYVHDKVFRYADASVKKVDYDIIKAKSLSKNTSAILDLKDNALTIDGVSNIVVSDSQRVALRPELDNKVVFKQNRDIKYDGRLYGGYGIFYGYNFNFNYENFQVDMDTIKFIELRIPDPGGAKDDNGNPVLASLNTKIEDARGNLVIDAPDNKSSREDYPQYPIFNSTAPSYVYYDNKFTQGGKYLRENFYFQLKPFTIEKLNAMEPSSLGFEGRLVSGGIFPEFEDNLEIKGDLSLGLTATTPPQGYDTYVNKGNYKGEIILDNDGLKGEGKLSYLTTEINSEDFLFLPNRMTATADFFDLREQRGTSVEFPKVHGEDVSVNWKPYKDSMYIRTAEKPFEMFDGGYTQVGELILTPGGLYGDGVFDWQDASITSSNIKFRGIGLSADTSALRIKMLGKKSIAFRTSNVKSDIDFEKGIGKFKSNTKALSTILPNNQYSTSMDEFVWDINGKNIDFKTNSGIATFLSLRADQDSLMFTGTSANYNLETSLLDIKGVESIKAADAFIYPKDGNVIVESRAKMQPLTDAVILADTSNQYHTINKATVEILGKNSYTATGGFYEYDVNNFKQELKFDNIEVTKIRIGEDKGKLVTIGEGRIAQEDNFYLDKKMFYQGAFQLKADQESLRFKGHARLNSPHLPDTAWFSIDSDIDRKNVFIPYEEPRNLRGDKVYAGVYIQRDSGEVYPVLMNRLRSRRDRALFETQGVIRYDDTDDNDFFYFGDSAKIMGDAKRGNLLSFNRVSGILDAEGKFNFSDKLDYVKVDAAGMGRFSVSGENNNVFNTVLGIDMIIPDALLAIFLRDFETNNFDFSDVDYKQDYVQYGLSEFITDDKRLDKIISEIEEYERITLPKENQNYTFFFGNVPFKWNPERESLVSQKSIGLSYIKDRPINRQVNAYIELRMSRSIEEVNIYISISNDTYYYFNYRNKILSVVSSNPTFNDAVMALKKDEYMFKMPDGEFYEVKSTGLNAVKFFLRRVENTWD